MGRVKYALSKSWRMAKTVGAVSLIVLFLLAMIPLILLISFQKTDLKSDPYWD